MHNIEPHVKSTFPYACTPEQEHQEQIEEQKSHPFCDFGEWLKLESKDCLHKLALVILDIIILWILFKIII